MKSSDFFPVDPGPVAILFDRFGPYHCARLQAAARRTNILALELCGRSRYADWEPTDTGDAFPRVTLFPDRDSSALSAAECRRRIFSVLDAHGPGAVATPGWGSSAALTALSWCAERGRPAILMSESTAQDKARFPWREAIKRRIVRRHGAAGLVGGRSQAQYLESLGMTPDRIFQGYDVVDNDHFATRADEVRADASQWRATLGLPDRYLLAVCRLAEEKNLLRLVEACAAYRADAGTDGAASLVIVGDGPLRAQILRYCESLGLKDHVMLPGFQQYDRLPAYYALADGFVLASVVEPWGLVVNEAMACGLPVLVSNRCGCAPELVVEGDNGWMVDPCDVAAMVTGLRKLANLPPSERVAMGRRGRDQIARWSPQLFADGLQQAENVARSAPSRRPGPADRWLLRALAPRP